MEIFFLVLAYVLLVIMFSRLSKQDRRIKDLENTVRLLRQGTEVVIAPPAAPAVQPRGQAAETPPRAAVAESTAPPAKKAPAPVSAPPAAAVATAQPAAVPSQPTPPIEKKPRPAWITALERQFAENWIGIIGAVILVLGIAFFGVAIALVMSPGARFGGVVASAGLLFGLSRYLRTREAWRNMALWLRSSAGAVFLFACLGAGAIPGLKWIDEPVAALALLGAGIVVNLVLGFVGRRQFIATFHVLISLASLAVAPASQTILIITGIVVLTGVLLAYRDRWEWHLLATITGYLAFHVWWYNSVPHGAGGSLELSLRITGIAVTAVTGIAAALVHYRAMYRDRHFEALPFAAHLANWCYMAVGFSLHATGSKWNTIILGVAALTAFALSRRAKALAIDWLFVTDTLVGQAIMVFALYTLRRWGFDALFINAVLFIEIVIFTVIMLREKIVVPATVGMVLQLCSGAMLILAAAASAGTVEGPAIYRELALLGGALVIQVLFYWYVRPKVVDDRRWLIFGGGVLAGVMGAVWYGMASHFFWAPYAAATLAVVLLVIRQRLNLEGLGAGLAILLLTLHGVTWYRMAEGPLTGLRALLYGLPVLVPSVAAVRWSWYESLKTSIGWPGIYLFFLHVAVGGYLVLEPVSPFLPGMLWLVSALLCVESSRMVRARGGIALDAAGSPDRHLYFTGFLLILAFLARHLLVHLQSEVVIGVVRVRLMVELFALAVFLFAATARRGLGDEAPRPWERFHPLLWEFTLLFAILTVAVEVPLRWHPLAWMGMAWLLCLAGNRFASFLSHFRLYAMLLHWAASVHIAVVASSQAVPSSKLMDQAWVAASIALALQLVFVIYYYRAARLETVSFPPLLSGLTKLAGAAARGRAAFAFYPFFIGTGLFFFWSFDKAILTLLWVMESFGILVLGLLLRERHFRHVSMAALGVCIIRLIFIDLAQTDAFTRIVVFLGVGALMVGMNMLINKFKDRFSV